MATCGAGRFGCYVSYRYRYVVTNPGAIPKVEPQGPVVRSAQHGPPGLTPADMSGCHIPSAAAVHEYNYVLYVQQYSRP